MLDAASLPAASPSRAQTPDPAPRPSPSGFAWAVGDRVVLRDAGLVGTVVRRRGDPWQAALRWYEISVDGMFVPLERREGELASGDNVVALGARRRAAPARSTPGTATSGDVA